MIANNLWFFNVIIIACLHYTQQDMNCNEGWFYFAYAMIIMYKCKFGVNDETRLIQEANLYGSMSKERL